MPGARSAVAGSAMLGGLCWIGAYAADAAGADGPVGPLTTVGAVLLAVAGLGVGAGLVSRTATWLRVVAAVGFVALTGSVLEVVRGGGDPQLVDAVVGVPVVVVAGAVLARASRARRAQRAAAGAVAGGPATPAPPVPAAAGRPVRPGARRATRARGR